jgi:hypothetical protein
MWVEGEGCGPDDDSLRSSSHLVGIQDLPWKRRPRHLTSCRGEDESQDVMDIWQRVAMDSLKFYSGPAMPYPSTGPAGGPTLKRPYSRFRDGLPTGRAACGRVPPHTVRLYETLEKMFIASRL